MDMTFTLCSPQISPAANTVEARAPHTLSVSKKPQARALASSFADDPTPTPKEQKRGHRYRAAKRNNIRRAKIIPSDQLRDLIAASSGTTLDAARTEVMVRLGFEAGLRAVEISGLQWDKHVLDAYGHIDLKITITNEISKQAAERTIPMSNGLRDALTRLRQMRPNDKFVVCPLSPRVDKVTGKVKNWIEPNSVAQSLKRHYLRLGLNGVTSHSGRRTFITYACRKAGTSPHFSLRDAQAIIGHNSLDTTAEYIELADDVSSLVSSLYD